MGRTASALNPEAQPPRASELEDALEQLVDRSPGPADLRAHGLHLVAARRWRSLGRPVPPDIAADEQGAALRSLAARIVLKRIGAAHQGPVILMKGLEVAARHSDPLVRPFDDIDILVADPVETERSLHAAGFQSIGYDAEYYASRHHLRPLYLPNFPVAVEVHRRPEWVRWSAAPTAGQLFEHAVPSRSGVHGIMAPAPAQHALLLAVHSWAAAPLRRILDLVDALLLAAEAEPGEVDYWAHRWDVEGLWSLTTTVHDVLLTGTRPPRSVQLWAPSLLRVRDATVLEQHLRRLLGSFSVLPFQRALLQAGREALNEVMPGEDEGWAEKLARTRLAIQHALIARNTHDQSLAQRRRPTQTPPHERER